MHFRTIIIALCVFVALPESNGLPEEGGNIGTKQNQDRMLTKSAAECDIIVDDFISKHSVMPQPRAHDKHDMLYFLHIPRTAGRTFHSCFLK